MSILPTDFLTRSWLFDSAERVAWTAAEAGVAIITVKVGDLPVSYVAIIAPALAALKAFIAKHVGNPADASTRRA
jgi:hypothetical protein